MKRLIIPLLILALVKVAFGYTYSTFTLTVTNGTLTNSTLTVNGATIQGATNFSSSTFLTNGSRLFATTNLMTYFGTYPKVGVIVSNTSPSNIVFQGASLTFSAHTNFASVSSNGIVISVSPYALMIPQESYPLSTRQSNAANIVTAIQLSSNAFPETTAPLSNFLSRGQVQTFGNKVVTNSHVTGSVVSNSYAVNMLGISGVGGSITNATLHSALLTNASGEFRGGYISNIIGVDVTVTNLAAPGSGNASQRLGTGAEASGAESLAFGVGAYALSNQTVAVGYAAGAEDQYSSSVGYQAAVVVGGQYGTAIGAQAYVSGRYGSAFGGYAASEYESSTALGHNAQTQTNNQIRLGTASEHISIPGEIRDVRITNSTLRGTNVINGRIDLTPRAHTSLANGYNSSVLVGTNSYIQFSGPSSAYTNAGFLAPGGPQNVIWQFDNPGLSMTFLDESGLEGTAANRIKTGTGSLLNSTNNPVMVHVIYDTSASRWRVISFR